MHLPLPPAMGSASVVPRGLWPSWAFVCAFALVSAGCLLDERGPPTDGPIDDDGDGYTAAEGDCDDRDPSRYPGARERCDGVDEDCDGEIDNDPLDPLQWWIDSDGDGYGDPLSQLFACTRPEGAVPDRRDCDDTNPGINPGATEVCNDRDDDCDRLVDDADPDNQYGPEHLWTRDRDGDGWGDASTLPVATCSTLPAHVNDRSDCDDTNPEISPDGVEICGGVDDDCDGLVDDDDPSRILDGAPWWFTDADGDGFGIGEAFQACALPAGAAASDGDCNDANPNSYPGAPELCDDDDNACDGGTDDGTASFESVDGTWTDETVILTGAPGAPAEVRYDTAGTLHLCAGVWPVSLTLGADITLIGTSEPSRVVLSGEDVSRVITVEAPDAEVEITGLTLERGRADEGGAVWMSGGVLTVRESVLWLSESTGSGGALWRSDGETTISDTEIRACSAGDRGGAAYLEGGQLLATGVILRDHAAVTSGGALHAEGTEVVLAMADIVSNTSGTDGGALALRDAPASFDDVLFSGNVAAEGSGGALHLSDVALQLQTSTLESNLASGNGGALWASGESADLEAVVLENNDATSGDGGAAVLVALTAWLDEVDVIDNTARSRGGGLLLDDTVLSGDDLTWSGNTPDDLFVLPVGESLEGTETLSCDTDGCL